MIVARFVVESPLQLLMANEARHQLGLHEESELVVLWPSGAVPQQAMRDVLAVDPWPLLVDGGKRSRAAMVGRASLIRKLASTPRSQLFVGDYLSPFMRHLLLKQPVGDAWLLDDGLGTVNTWSIRTDPNARHGRSDEQSRKRRLAMAVLGLSTGHPKVLRYFTFFDLPGAETELITRNSLELLKKSLPTSKPDESMLFLGAPFVEHEKMKEDHYVALVSLVAAQHSVMKYRPHRLETAAKLERLKHEAGVEVVSAAGTIELELTRVASLPGTIMSFFSSATVPIFKLVGDRVSVGSYALEESDFLDDWFDVGDGVPTLLDQTGGAITIKALPGRGPEYIQRYQQKPDIA